MGFPTEHIALRHVGHAKSSKHEEQLGPVVHGVCDDVRDRAAEGALNRRRLGWIDPSVVQAASLGKPSCAGGQLRCDDIEPVQEAINRCVTIGADRGPVHEIGPSFHVANDVAKGGAKRAEPQVEGLVELCIGERLRKQEQLARGPGIVSEQA